jgi:hypothetical protein
MHLMGHGLPADLADLVKPAPDLIGSGSPKSDVPLIPPIPSPGTAAVSKIVGQRGNRKGVFRSALDQLRKSTS